MAVREYVGARYVPKFDGEWDNTKSYEPLTVVTVLNVCSYTSKKYVPVGVAITDTEYWVLTSNLSGQMIQLQEEVDALNAAVKTPEHFGAKGDGLTDDTVAINNALSGGGFIVFKEDATYIVDPDVGLLIDDNSVIDLNGATIEAKAVSSDYYEIFHINQKKNVVLSNGIVKGERTSHTGTTGEWGMCVYVGGSQDILIDNLKISDAWGDGIYIGDTKTYDNIKCINVRVQNCVIDNCRRQGISITFAENVIVDKNIIKNTNGTAPQGAIDVEPNANLVCKKVIISENILLDNKRGMAISGAAAGSVVDDIMITKNIIKAASAVEAAIQVNDAKHIVVDGNSITDFTSTKSIIYVVSDEYITISNNTCSDCQCGASAILLACNDVVFENNALNAITMTGGDCLYILNGTTCKVTNNSFRNIIVPTGEYIIYLAGSSTAPANSNMIKCNTMIGLICDYVIAFGNYANNNHIMFNTIYKGAIGATPGDYDYVAYCRVAAAGDNFAFNDVQAGNTDVCGGSPAYGGTIAQNMVVNTLVP